MTTTPTQKLIRATRELFAAINATSDAHSAAVTALNKRCNDRATALDVTPEEIFESKTRAAALYAVFDALNTAHDTLEQMIAADARKARAA